MSVRKCYLGLMINSLIAILYIFRLLKVKPWRLSLKIHKLRETAFNITTRDRSKLGDYWIGVFTKSSGDATSVPATTCYHLQFMKPWFLFKTLVNLFRSFANCHLMASLGFIRPNNTCFMQKPLIFHNLLIKHSRYQFMRENTTVLIYSKLRGLLIS
jgi:hypothetical protein